MEVVQSRRIKSIILLLLNVQLITVSIGHNWLLEPYAYNTNWRTETCQGSECKNACPEMLEPQKMFNEPEAPAAIWRRGQTVRMCYARNNHHGGFARFSLVPVNVMNSREWHEKFTLFHTCFGAGEQRCRKTKNIKRLQDLSVDPPCGTDKGNVAYCRYFTIPDIFPDGNYVLGHVWYGGTNFKKEVGQFADYYSCSFITIKGGNKSMCDWKDSQEKYKPIFDIDVKPDNRGMVKGKCLSSVRRIGPCDRFGCPDRKPRYTTPKAFDGAGPKGFKCGHLRKAFEQERTKEMNILKGVCKGEVCCPKACGKCGGSRCDKKGLGSSCCMGAIHRSKRKCEDFEPPCLRYWHRIIAQLEQRISEARN